MTNVCGIVAEYNPFHAGHAYHIAETRRILGADTRIIAVMSGNVVQRGEFAILPKHERTLMALRGGVDLVLELPSRCVLQSAERFAHAAVSLIAASGVVTHLSFGCEDAQADLASVARELLSPQIHEDIKSQLAVGVSYPTARASAVGSPLLETPNNILGIEYLKALHRLDSRIIPLQIQRIGAPHDAVDIGYAYPSASSIRKEMRDTGTACAELPELVLLSHLRRLTLSDWACIPDVTEGLEHRLYRASLSACSLPELLSLIKTKRYTLSRIRRIIMRAFLSLYGNDNEPKALRVLGFNAKGAELLHHMKHTARLPVITRPAAHKALLSEESSVTDLFHLCMSEPLRGGLEYEISPIRAT